MATIALHIFSSCKTATPRASRAGMQAVSNEVDTNEQIVSNIVSPVTDDGLCEVLKSDDFPGDSVSPQVQWLCDRGGFATLKSKAYGGHGVGAITEFFAEHDKTLYYASGFSLAGSFAKLSSIGRLFCEDFEALRKKVGGLGLDSVKSINVSRKDSDSCEYLQEAVPEWGVRADLKALTSYGILEGKNVFSRVDTMIAPLNYSPLKQFSSLVLIWESLPNRVEGVYLIKSQVNVSGALMGITRARLKSTITSSFEGFAKLLGENFAAQENKYFAN